MTDNNKHGVPAHAPVYLPVCEVRRRIREPRGFRSRPPRLPVVWRKEHDTHGQRLCPAERQSGGRPGAPVPVVPVGGRRLSLSTLNPRFSAERLMREPDPVNDPPNSLWSHFKRAFRRQNARRPVSFYLMLAIIVVLLLGLQMAHYRGEPRRFALVLSAMFIFFFIVLWRAAVEAMDIIRRSYREERELFRSTLGNPEFNEQLGKGVVGHGPAAPPDDDAPVTPDD